MGMNRGFIFMLDAFISLLIVIAFIGTLNQYSRDYLYIQDETLYSYGRSMMDILLNHNIKAEIGGTEREIPLIHALGSSKGQGEWSRITSNIPSQYGYRLEYYNNSKGEWVKFEDIRQKPKKSPMKSVSIVSTVPVIVRNENYTTPFKYLPYCDPGDNICMNPRDLYTPDEFASYENTFVRLVIEV